MKPQLLYLYIHDIGRCFERQQFLFTNDFDIQFNSEDRKLSIKKLYNPFNGIWGNNVSSINLIVGKNGAGKTTIMDLLGSTKTRKINMFYNSQSREQEIKPEMDWFVLYHITDDIFVIEGYEPGFIANLEGLWGGASQDYSISVQYDYAEQKAIFRSYIQEPEELEKRSRPLEAVFRTLYMTNERKRDWFKSSFPAEGDDHFVGFKRDYMNRPTNAVLYQFMIAQGILLEPDFAAIDPRCSLELKDWMFRDITFTEDRKSAFDLELYQDKEKAIYFNWQSKNDQVFTNLVSYLNRRPQYGQLTYKQMFIICYLEMLIMDIWMNSIKTRYNQEIIDEYQEHFRVELKFTDESENQYDARFSYLCDALRFFEKIRVGFYDPDWPNFDTDSIFRFVAALLDLPDNLFSSSKVMLVSVRGSFNEEVFKCLKCIDDEGKALHGNHFLFQVRFENLSAGELEFISGFANLSTAIKYTVANWEFDTLLLQLDEPDASFHPEWSRRYIHNLVNFLNNIDIRRPVNFQIMITTHSPFIVSDVPSPFITCLELKREEDGSYTRIVKKADFGLMSNIYDILRTDFFISSPIGEQAKLFFNELADRIDKLDDYNPEQIKELRGRVTAIGEPFIQEKLMEQLEEAERRLMPVDLRERRIQELQRQIEHLRQLNGDEGSQ